MAETSRTDRSVSGQVRGVEPKVDLAVMNGGGAELNALFSRLYDEHFDFVWRSLRRFGLSRALADDGVQEVFIVVHRRLADYDTSRAARGWLYGIARRVAATMLRGEYRAQRKIAAVTSPEPGDMEQDVARQQAVSLMEAFLTELDDVQREVFVLVEVEGLTAPEAAAALGVKLNTVYSRLRRARARFQRAIKRHNQEASRV